MVVLSARPKERRLVEGVRILPLVKSRQAAATTAINITSHEDAPPPPLLPLDGYSLNPSVCSFVHREHEFIHMSSLATTLETAHKVDSATKEQSLLLERHHLRKPRITSSCFRDVCHVREQSSAEHLADRILSGTRQSAEMKRGLQMKSAAVEEYYVLRNNRMPVSEAANCSKQNRRRTDISSTSPQLLYLLTEIFALLQCQ
ncbi:unnamed protein product, partial [Coregonus sp. 'balchen']